MSNVSLEPLLTAFHPFENPLGMEVVDKKILSLLASQLMNTFLSVFLTLSVKIIVSKFVQFAKQFSLTELVVLGVTNDVSELQPLNKSLDKTWTLGVSSNSISLNLLHPLNALAPKLATWYGIVILVRLTQSWNAAP